jgi:hypothetical protein
VSTGNVAADFLRDSVAGVARAQWDAANTLDMRAYWVRHLRGNIVEAQFEALAVDSLACATDHPPPEGCRVAVMPLAEWRDKCWREQDARGGIVHVVAPASSGSGIGDSKCMRCTCGWVGPNASRRTTS